MAKKIVALSFRQEKYAGNGMLTSGNQFTFDTTLENGMTILALDGAGFTIHFSDDTEIVTQRCYWTEHGEKGFDDYHFSVKFI